MEGTKELITTDVIRSKVYIIRGQQVMLDRDLAEIYGNDEHVYGEQNRSDEYDSFRHINTGYCACVKPHVSRWRACVIFLFCGTALHQLYE